MLIIISSKCTDVLGLVLVVMCFKLHNSQTSDQMFPSKLEMLKITDKYLLQVLFLIWSSICEVIGNILD